MNSQLIIDLIHQQLLPRIAQQDFSLSPLANHKNFQSVFPYTLHSHSFFEWIWCMENEAFLQIDAQVYSLHAGDFILLPPGEVHADVFSPTTPTNKILWCASDNGKLGAHLHAYTPVNHQQHIAGISAPTPPFLLSLLGTLQYEWKSSQHHRQAICASLVQALAHVMLRAFEDANDNQEDFIPGKIAVRVNWFLNEHFHEAVSLAHIARAMHVSRNYLATLYKKETGITIGQMLREIRLQQAKKLLLEADMTVQQISQAVGYSTPEHFSRVFVEQVGVTPGKYGKR